MQIYLGHCLCAEIRYEVRGTIGPIVYCHCSQCRRAQGSAFAANAQVKTADFIITTGEEHIKEFDSGSGKFRCFCSHCGSPLFSKKVDKPDVIRLRIGTLETPIPNRPTAHIYATSRAEWDEICDDLPQYEGVEPGR